MARDGTQDARAVFGRAAEAAAATFLTVQGLTVVARNLRCRMGEIDLVCRQDDLLIVVEVRARTRADFGGAIESVNPAKRRRIILATRYHLSQRPEWQALQVRFDVIAFHGAELGIGKPQWLQNAF